MGFLFKKKKCPLQFSFISNSCYIISFLFVPFFSLRPCFLLWYSWPMVIFSHPLIHIHPFHSLHCSINRMVWKSQSSIQIDCEKSIKCFTLFSIPFLHCPMDRMVGKSQSSIRIDCEKVSNVLLCFPFHSILALSNG